MAKHPALTLALTLFAIPASARKLEVGPGKAYAKPSAAAAAAQSGDTVDITAGVYPSDAAAWSASNLLIRGVGGMAHLQSGGAAVQGKGIWVITGANTTVENIEFSQASVPDHNGAGIRQEGAGLTVRKCSFHDNENGILSGENLQSDIVIENTVFASNGRGDGFTHNIYIGHVRSFTLRYCHTHRAKVGHNIKSRANRNVILYNRSENGSDGTASYELDLPNGGESFVIGNVFQQGPAAGNPTLISFGAEGLSNPGSALYAANNTLVNDRPGGGTGINVYSNATGKVWNNLYVGAGSLLAGGSAMDTSANLQTNATTVFVNRSTGDYRLAAGSPALDKGKDPGTAGGMALKPSLEYVHPAASRPRPVNGALDLGAFEFEDGAPVRSGPKGNTGKAGPEMKSPSGNLRIFPRGAFWVDALGKKQG